MIPRIKGFTADEMDTLRADVLHAAENGINPVRSDFRYELAAKLNEATQYVGVPETLTYDSAELSGDSVIISFAEGQQWRFRLGEATDLAVQMSIRLRQKM
jgi:hypothetical protein